MRYNIACITYLINNILVIATLRNYQQSVNITTRGAVPLNTYIKVDYVTFSFKIDEGLSYNNLVWLLALRKVLYPIVIITIYSFFLP